jgi:hypothetical protein
MYLKIPIFRHIFVEIVIVKPLKYINFKIFKFITKVIMKNFNGNIYII